MNMSLLSLSVALVLSILLGNVTHQHDQILLEILEVFLHLTNMNLSLLSLNIALSLSILLGNVTHQHRQILLDNLEKIL